jgi:iron complex outermembrane recepter protein
MDDRGPAFARGFRVDFYDLRRDGLRTYSWSVREPAAVDRVQYLRGPAAVLYGDGSPGGLVNMVLKKPLPVRRYEVTASAGGLGFGRVTADATGPVTAGGGLRYRVVASGETLENGFDNDERRLSVLPMVSIDLGRSTLHLDAEYYDQRGRNYWHWVPATSDTDRGDFTSLPWDLNTASPDDRWRGWNISPGLRLDSRISDEVTLHAAARYTRIEGDIDIQGLLGLAPDGRTARRFYYRELSVWDEYQSDTFVAVSSTTGPITHRLVAGLEAGLSTTDSQIGVSGAPTLDIYDPVYAPRPPEPELFPTRFDVWRVGVYALDQIRLTPKVTAVPGLRWSRLRVEDLNPSSDPISVDSALSPSLGLVFMATPSLSIYSSYARGLEPPAPGLYAEDGLALTPVKHRSIEGGVKADLARGRMAVTGSLYRIVQENVAEADGRGFYRQIGEGESHGAEVEITGVVARGLAVRGGYAWTRTEITQDASGFVGRDLPNAPRHKANVWAQYQFGAEPLKRLTVGSGVVFVSDRFTGRDNVVIAPSYARVDATASYPLAGPKLTLGLAVQNIGNVRYVTSGAGAALYAGPPRRIAMQIGSAF